MVKGPAFDSEDGRIEVFAPGKMVLSLRRNKRKMLLTSANIEWNGGEQA